MSLNYTNAVKKVYEELNDCIIIGLTGRTGSGCTTVSKILETKNFEELHLSTPKTYDFKNIEERKYQIIHRFMKHNWVPFSTIEASSIILSFVLEKTNHEFITFLEELTNEENTYKFHIGGIKDLIIRLSRFEHLFNKSMPKIDNISELSDKEIEKYYDYYTMSIKTYKKAFYDLLSDFSCYESQKSNFHQTKEKKSQLYSYLMQLFGNNIRSSGDPFNSEMNQENFHAVSKRINSVVDIIKRHNKMHNRKTRICIDAIRNPYEAYFFKDKYRCFYLVSVSTEDVERRARLTKFDEEQLKSLDDMEYPVDFDSGKIFYQQSIAECLQMSDIHLYNPHSNDRRYELITQNMVRYISLMLHPGLIAPTDVERCMQVAFNAKFNSGCLSRQVGSVITDNKFYIKAIGWNNPPQGQVPCSLRTIQNYITDNDRDTFSKFEIENQEFSTNLNKINRFYTEFLRGSESLYYSVPYCFKDIYNGIKKDKNQVFTRSLHAEENAFLQISKFGGTGIQGGKLFVTASPCELCSKKSYQLGIRDIYYIDPYPGIATSHILKIGEKPENPTLHLFYGAIGNAYVSLYMQRFAIKDELNLVSGINMKNVINSDDSEEEKFDDVKYKNVHRELVFNSRTELVFLQKASLVSTKKELKTVKKTLSWSGSSYEKTIPIDSGSNYSVIENGVKNGKYSFEIKPVKSINIGDSFEYDIKTIVRDELEIMNPILSHYVRAKTEKLTIAIKFNKEKFLEKVPDKAILRVYADIEKNAIYEEKDLLVMDDEDFITYYQEIQNPCLFYTYSIEWEF